MDRASRILFNRLGRLKRRNTPLTVEERNNLINSLGLYKVLSNRNPSVIGVMYELLGEK
jgi:hypothetical protein